ncbi:maleylpyruvate isomerase N-terminal domain-containing protein [Blastococcus sp. TML/M2B]|nr:maleylpyruvate isomerase N-terminal domain-containing protein [Blastococcus sp. TML/M2B]MBN1092643.1 maleylpyruvate isomerase N-terminal domain-containing protein [Blastococcus sp. TML/M2B]
MTDVDAVAADLAAEHASLDAVLDGLTDQQWATPTPSPGWTVADQVGHLTYFDGAAVLALTDEAAFTASIGPLLEDMDGVTLHRHLAPAALLAAWRANRARLLDVVGQVDPAGRAPWYGPSMSVRSFLTARLMETWAHGPRRRRRRRGDPRADRPAPAHLPDRLHHADVDLRQPARGAARRRGPARAHRTLGRGLALGPGRRRGVRPRAGAGLLPRRHPAAARRRHRAGDRRRGRPRLDGEGAGLRRRRHRRPAARRPSLTSATHPSPHP